MSPQTEMLISQALQLSPEERASIIAELWQSLDPFGAADDPGLLEEMERRLRAVEAGCSPVFDHSEVMAEMRAKYGW